MRVNAAVRSRRPSGMILTTASFMLSNRAECGTSPKKPKPEAIPLSRTSVVFAGSAACCSGRKAPHSGVSDPRARPCPDCGRRPTGCSYDVRVGRSRATTARSAALPPVPRSSRYRARHGCPRSRNRQAGNDRAGDRVAGRHWLTPKAAMSVKSDRPAPPELCTWRKKASCSSPWMARQERIRRSSVRRTPLPSSGCRRITSSKMATGRMPGAAFSNGATSASKISVRGSGRRRPRDVFFCDGSRGSVSMR